MRKVVVISILILLMLLLMASFVEGEDMGYVPAQCNPQETGEILPDPNLILEPDVEIGDFSPEFSYDYELEGDNGRLDLIWTHTPGYYISFGYGYPYQECDEYARMWQDFTWEYNQTPTTMKVSASIQISCTGDFATRENGDDMFEIKYWIGIPVPPTGFRSWIPIKTISDLRDGQSYDIQFLLSNYEAQSIFMGSVMYGGVQAYPNDLYRLYVGLIPSIQFSDVYGGSDPWMYFDGSVTATISHFSANALLEVDEQAPPLIVPKFNNTALWNDTSRRMGIEAMGQSSFVYLDSSSGSYFSGQYSLVKMTSEHLHIWNQTFSNEVFYSSPIMNMEVVDNSIFFLTANQTVGGGEILLLKFDSVGNSIWNKTIQLFDNDIPLYLDVASTGTIYILTISLRGQPSVQAEIVYSLARLDSMGNLVWNRTVYSMSYEEYASSGYELQFPKGIGCAGGNVYLGMMDSVLRYDSDGNQVWNKTCEFTSFCNDPSGGFYTSTIQDNGEFRLSRWNTAGSIVWNRSLSLNYGSGWQDYPLLQRMEVGPSGQLYLVLEYMHIDPVITVARISLSGELISHDTIFDLDEWSPYGPVYYSLSPLITDLAITGDGLVHLTVSNEYPSVPVYGSFFSIPAETLLTYEISGPITFTLSPESMIIMGVATLIFGGIAWDHFIRRRTRPEDILPEQEKIDPWDILMGDTEDK
jgi:hypothetical protein